LGFIWAKGEWAFSYLLGWVYLGQLKHSSIDDGFWIYSSGKEGGNNSGWIWTSESLKKQYWFFYSLNQDDDSSTNWITPLYDSNDALKEFFVYTKNTTKNVRDYYIINNRKYAIVEKSYAGYFLGHSSAFEPNGTGKISTTHSISINTPSSIGGKTLNERRKDLIDSGYYKSTSIINIEAITESESIQRENSIKITLSSYNNLSIVDSQEVFIEEVVSSDAFDDNINVVYIYDSVDKKWTTTVDPWLLVKINDFEFELKDSSSLYSLFNSGNVTNFGNINFVPSVKTKAERVLEGQLFRTMNVKEDKNNTYSVVGLEYNSSKFDAVDKKTVIRKPVFPIPPQADMTIPESPDSLILTDLTR
jgi:hypothetical protein